MAVIFFEQKETGQEETAENLEDLELLNKNIRDSHIDKRIKEQLPFLKDFELFTDTAGAPYISIKKEKRGYITNDHLFDLNDKVFNEWLTKCFFDNDLPSSNSNVSKIIKILRARARVNNNSKTFHNRIAEHDGKFYYNNSKGSIIEITPDGWSKRPGPGDNYDYKPPIYFHWYTHQYSNNPEKGEYDIKELLKYIPIPDDSDKMLFLVYLITAIIPKIQHPVLHCYGPGGSGKSTIVMILNGLIDPSNSEEQDFPLSERDAYMLLNNHYLSTYDNVTGIKVWLNNILCKASTGATMSTRGLHTSSKEVFFELYRCVCIFSTDQIITRPDLLDRSILMKLCRVAEIVPETIEHRILEYRFNREKGIIFGAMLDVVSRAMSIYPTLKLKNLPRMADFAMWGEAVSQAIGYEPELFYNVYKQNISKQTEEIIAKSTLFQSIIMFMQDKTEWKGLTKELHDALKSLITPDISKEDFPKHCKDLKTPISRMDTYLKNVGIQVTFLPRSTEGYLILIRKVVQ